MATTQQTQKPPPPHDTHSHDDRQKGAADKSSPDDFDDPIKSSQKIEEMGIDNWITAHDDRNPEAKPKQVPGVAPVYGGEQPGTVDTAPEGHDEDDMQPGAGEPGGPTAGHYVATDEASQSKSKSEDKDKDKDKGRAS